MNPYILDYSDSNDLGRQPDHNDPRRKRMYRTLKRVLILSNGLLYCVALAYLIRQHTELNQIRMHYHDQVIQYDSLLAAKLETEQQVAALHRQLVLARRAGLPTGYP
ncbi:hypothetical protein [Spirosoma sp.]|uniref:hypothetical protein n=1 Tax=Spirosoma sp. TaxID=1899569 RepID=UPI002632645D|nr:hypothetical protein [Spirosoma sp.]MCX6217762.1 hypothetical protein [Spirosoma sp.]